MRTWLLLLLCAVIVPTRTAFAQVSVDLPLGVGLQMPSYDRVDGLVLPYGPTIAVGNDLLTIDPTVTYRSQLGKFDPSLAIAWHPASAVTVSASGARGTFTNDSWIRSDLINSLYALGFGYDARNYFRADRTEGKVALNLPFGTAVNSLYAGVRFENAWSTGAQVVDRDAPFSFFHPHDTVNGMERTNPAITPGHIVSAIVGGESHYEGEHVSNAGWFLAESAWHTPTDDTFQQVTLHDEGVFRTWDGERLEYTFHGVAPLSGTTPPQRYAYLGGSGSLATINLLSLGGDHLYYVETLYDIPLPGPSFPLLGSLFIAPHFIGGAASVGGFGVPSQNVGIRLGDQILRLDFLVNPRTHKTDFGAGLGFSR